MDAVMGEDFSCHRGIKLTLSTTVKELRKTLFRERRTFVWISAPARGSGASRAS
jgi:hypothetical protein